MSNGTSLFLVWGWPLRAERQKSLEGDSAGHFRPMFTIGRKFIVLMRRDEKGMNDRVMCPAR